MSNSKGEFGTDGVVNKDLPQGWTLYPLEEVVEIHNSLRKPINASERSKRDGIYPYYGATGQVGWIDDFRQDGEYVLLGEDGAPFLDITKDKAYIVSGKCWVNNHAHVLKGQKGKCLNKYLLHSLNQTDFRSLVNGTTRLKLTQASLRKIPINLAPLDVQESIVAKIEELFSELDSGIASLKTAQEQLKIYRQALLKHAFEGKLTEQWRKDNADKLETPEQLLARIQTERETRYQQQLDEWKQAVKDWEAKGKEGKNPRKPKKLNSFESTLDSEVQVLPTVPKNWCFTTLGEFIDQITAGKSFKCEEREPSNDEIGVAKVSAVTWGEYNETESKTCTDLAKINSDYFIETDDFIFSRANTIELVGACVIAKKVTKKIMLSDKTLRINFMNINKLYILHYLRSHFGRKEIMERSTGNQESMRNIGQERIKSIVMPICSLDEQQEIVNQLEEKLSIIEQNEKEIETALAKAELLRQSILKKAFSGQLVSQVQNG